MKLHPRHQPMTLAKLKIMTCIAQVALEYELTFGEMWAILCEIGASWAKGAIREERRGEDQSDGSSRT